MSIEMQDHVIAPGATHTFAFDGAIDSYLVGIQQLYMTYGGTDHHVGNLSVQLLHNKVADDKVAVTPKLVLDDASGHGISPDSYAKVSVIAHRGGGGSQDLFLAQAGVIPSGGSSPPIGLPGSRPRISQAFCDGFHMRYDTDDHHVRTLAAHAGATQSSDHTSVQITAFAEMKDASGNDASATMDGGYLATFRDVGLEARGWSGMRLQVPELEGPVPGPAGQMIGPVQVRFSGPIVQATAWLVGYHASFGNTDHHLKTLQVGAAQLTRNPTDPDALWLMADCMMFDGSGNAVLGNLDVVVLATIGTD